MIARMQGPAPVLPETGHHPVCALDGELDSDIWDAEAFRSLFRHSGHAIAKIDSGSSVVVVNDDWAALFDVTRESVVQVPLREFVHSTARAALDAAMAGLRAGPAGRVNQAVVCVRGSAGEVFAAELSAVAVAEAGGFGFIVAIDPDNEAQIRQRAATAPLSARDALILEGIAVGASTAQLAAQSFMSRQGIEYRVSVLLRRFQVPNRAALVSRAASMGLFVPIVWPPKVRPEMVCD
jgi:PAS domain S-box-containing protein